MELVQKLDALKSTVNQSIKEIEEMETYNNRVHVKLNPIESLKQQQLIGQMNILKQIQGILKTM